MCTTGTVTMTANTTCTATFTLIPAPPAQWTLTSIKAGTGSGATTGAGTYVNGTVVTMTAVPATGSTFAGWAGTGCTTGTVTMLDPQTVQIRLNNFDSTSGPGVHLNVSAGNGIIASDDGAKWSGCTRSTA